MASFAFLLSLWFSLWLGRPVAALSVGPQPPSICQELNDKYNAVLFLRNESQYPEARIKNWSQTSWKTPGCIFKPSTARHLQQVVPLLVASETKFAIRSGGHMPSPEAANIDGGVLIDLSSFNEVSYDEKAQVAVVGTGLTWGDVYERLAPFGVTVVGGRVSSVGVGGLTLGSGLSYLSDLYGLACDNVVNFKVVLADGTIVDANRKNHADLFWALKGGTNNFGIVLSFTLSTYKIGDVWAGIKLYTLDDLPALFDAMLEYQSVPEKDPYANLMLQGFLSNDTAGIILNLIYLKPEASPAAFEPFYHINATADTTNITSYVDFVAGQGPGSTFPPRIYWRTTSFEPNKDVYGSLTQLLTHSDALERIKSATAGTSVFGLQPISSRVVDQGDRRGGNALGLSPVDQTWFVLDAGNWFAEDDNVIVEATRDMMEPVINEAKAEGAHLPYIFMNDAGWDQDVIGSYGHENVARLKKVQAKYDSCRVFQKLVPGGFKLP